MQIAHAEHLFFHLLLVQRFRVQTAGHAGGKRGEGGEGEAEGGDDGDGGGEGDGLAGDSGDGIGGPEQSLHARGQHSAMS